MIYTLSESMRVTLESLHEVKNRCLSWSQFFHDDEDRRIAMGQRLTHLIAYACFWRLIPCLETLLLDLTRPWFPVKTTSYSVCGVHP
jgi:hypothetical protein